MGWVSLHSESGPLAPGQTEAMPAYTKSPGNAEAWNVCRDSHPAGLHGPSVVSRRCLTKRNRACLDVLVAGREKANGRFRLRPSNLSQGINGDWRHRFDCSDN